MNRIPRLLEGILQELAQSEDPVVRMDAAYIGAITCNPRIFFDWDHECGWYILSPYVGVEVVEPKGSMLETFLSLMDERDHPAIRAAWERSLQEGCRFSVTCRRKPRHGGKVPARWISFLAYLQAHRGEVTRFFGVDLEMDRHRLPRLCCVINNSDPCESFST